MTAPGVFDANVCVGAWVTGTFPGPVDAAEFESALDAAGVDKALLWHRAQRDCSAQEGNRLLVEAFGGSDRAALSWCLLPPGTDGPNAPELFEAMRAAGVTALRAFPEYHRYFPRRTVFGTLLDEVADRRIPVVLSVESDASWSGIYGLLEDYPALTCIVCDTGIWNGDRYLWPLLDRFERIYAETSCISLAAGGLETAVARFGAERFVFGSGYPVRYPEAALMDLQRAGLAPADQARISSGNLVRLLGESTP